MLKAVRFDLEDHKELIEFVENYRDKKNRPNHSEAIRLLMQKGLEQLNKKEEPKQEINVEALKQDIMSQIMSQINLQTIQSQQVSSTPSVQQTRVSIQEPKHTDVFTIVNEDTPEPPPKPVPSPPRTDAVPLNPLLANILGNSQR